MQTLQPYRVYSNVEINCVHTTAVSEFFVVFLFFSFLFLRNTKNKKKMLETNAMESNEMKKKKGDKLRNLQKYCLCYYEIILK